jgi:nucleotide-binding universal stress UspA family protein
MRVKSSVIRSVLVGYNGSPAAQRALLFADRLARLSHAQLHIVAVAQTPSPLGAEVEGRAIIEQARRDCRRALRAARMKISRPAHVRVLVGEPARQIVRYALAHQIDHIVLGSRVRVLFGHGTMSAIARQVIVFANCAVTTVPAANPSAGRLIEATEHSASLRLALKGSP